MKVEHITERQIDIIKELINIGAGKGAEVLNSFLSSHVTLSVPDIRLVTGRELRNVFLIDKEEYLSSVEMNFSGSVSGVAELIFLSENAAKLVELITGEQDIDHDFDEVKTATFTEVGNIIINAVLGSISNELKLKLNFTIPTYIEGNIDNLFSLLIKDERSVIIVAKTQFIIKKTEIEGSIAIFFGLHSFDSFIEAIDNYV